jgi:hypothetical protein
VPIIFDSASTSGNQRVRDIDPIRYLLVGPKSTSSAMDKEETNPLSHLTLRENSSNGHHQAKMPNGITDHTPSLSSNAVPNGSINGLTSNPCDGGTGGTSPRGVDVPVLIVGGGPTGLLMSYMLSQLGGSCAIVHSPITSI